MPLARTYVGGSGSTTAVGPSLTIITDENSITTGSITATWDAWNRELTLSATGGAVSIAGPVLTTNSDVQLTWVRWSEDITSNGSRGTTTVITHPNTPTTASIDSTWSAWNGTMAVHAGGGAVATRALPAVRLTDEEYQARLQRQEEQRREMLEREAQRSRERAKADEKAELILTENLSERQKAELKDKRYFTLTKIDSASKQRRHYQIHRGRAGNVIEVDENGKQLNKFCIHPREDVPNADTMLTQKLWLDTREEEFRRVANITRLG